MAEIASARGLDFTDEGDRFEARREIKAVMQEWAGGRPFAEAAECLDALGVCWGPYQTFADLVGNDPRCSAAAGLFREVDQPGIGPYLVPGSPLAFPTGVGQGPDSLGDTTVAPELGQHTDEVLSGWLGLSAGEIGRLHDAGVVASGS